MQYGTRGVVLRARNLEEFDRSLVLLTADHGLVSAYAKGARRQKGAQASATEQLSYSSFELFENRERTYVDKAESDTIFFAIRQDMEKLSLATYFCQLCQELVPQGDTQEDYLRLLLNTLYLLDRGSTALLQLKAVFELRLLTMSGYMPDLVACSRCGSLGEGAVFFSPAAGVAFCQDCAPAAGVLTIPLGRGTFDAMRHIIYSDFAKLFAFRLPPAALEELSRVSEAYLLAQVERVLPALDFYKTVCQPT